MVFVTDLNKFGEEHDIADSIMRLDVPVILFCDLACTLPGKKGVDKVFL